MERAEKHHLLLREWLPLLAVVSCAFVFNASEFMPVALLTDIAESFALTASQAGMVITVYAWMVMILSLPLMIVASRLDFRRLLLLVVVVFCAGQVGSALAPSFGWLMAARVVVASAHAVFWSIATPLAIRVVSEEHRAFAMGLVVMGSSVAMIVGLPLGRVVGLALGWRMTFACIAAISAAVLAYAFAVLPTMERPNPFAVGRLPVLFRTKALRGVYVIVVLVVLGYYACYSYIEPFMLQVTGMDPATVTVALSVFGLAGVAGSALFSRFYGCLRTRFLLVAVAGVVASLAALGPMGGSALGVVVSCTCMGLFGTAMNVALQSEVIRNSALDDQAVATSIYSGIFNLGIGGGSAIGGAVCAYAGLGLIGWAGAALAALGLVYGIFVLVPRLKASHS